MAGIGRPGLKGLRGLRGFGDLSTEEREAFLYRNAGKLSKYGDNPMRYGIAAEKLYNNQKFIERFGLDKFNQLSNGTQEAYDYRNELFRTDVINEVGQEWGNPFNKDGTRNNNKGLGADWERFQELSPDAKLKLMESEYLTPKEFEDTWKKEVNKYARYKEATNKGFSGFLKNAAQSMNVTGGLYTNIDNDTNEMDNEGVKRFKKDANQKIFDRIYNEDVDNTTSKLSDAVSKAYYDLLNLDDNQIKSAFYKEIKKGSYRNKNGMPNAGIGPYEAYKGESEMQDFTIDDMRQTLAKKKVYETYLSPTMAATALNNEAQRYIKEHQGSVKKTALFAKDVAIASMSYTADKINGIAELYRASADKADPKGKPIVMVDDMGNIVDRTKTHVYSTRDGNLFYREGNGKIHSVFRKQVDRTTLHNMGKNQDGSDIQGAFGVDWMTLNPQYWTKAEQFGTLDANEQKQYEKIGFSPYKVMYDPNEESDLWYEAFKMMSFGIADMAAQLIPFGVGSVGKALSTASKVGKIARGFGKVLDTTGKLLTAETKVGAGIQGISGALGIAYAYDRGAFQETLQQNLANAEEAVVARGKNEIYDKYNTDKEYKAEVDKLINARAAKMKIEYKAQLQKDGGKKIVDEKLLDKMLHSKAQEAVLGELLQNRIQEIKSSKDYGDLMQKAINGAGDAAFNTFLPEAIKYGLVNTMGHRKFLYSNPTGVAKKLSSTLKGLKEITTKDGRLRLAADASKFLTRGDKLKQLGKTAVSQAWGGAWTNGTDDMQVDAAERINEDSFNRYLNSFQNGEALADTYGTIDGLFSYLKGLQNSTGQETTFNAATVGALGSLVNFAPHFTNIAKLATKEGREFYKNNYLRRAERDADENLIKNEDGTVKYRDLGKWENFGDKLGFFIQNGVLNTYYGKKQAERDLQNHADYVNNILDSYNDFKDIEGLVASNIASENVINAGDAKTIQFIKALHAINALRSLGNNAKDPASLSSVVEKNKKLIEKTSQLNLEEGKNPFSEEEIKQLLAEYYSSNPGIEQNDANSQKALYTIAKNAQKLQKAADAFNKANEELDKMEKSKGITMDPEVKTRLSLQQALDGHWKERNGKMKSEIDDPSSDIKPTDPNIIIASVGGRKNAQTLISVYDKQRAELNKQLSEQKEKTKKLREEAEKVDKEVTKVKESVEGMLTPELQKKQKEAHAELDNSINQEKYLDDLITRTAGKRQSLKTSIEDAQVDETTQRVTLAEKELAEVQSKLDEARNKRASWIDEAGKAKKRHGKQVEKINKEIAELESTVIQKKEELERSKERVLTADEIFSLDPVTRARMMAKENRSLYSKEQQREIESLEDRLLMRDADALQKIQDISLLTQRIEKNQDAYSRILQNPEAAAVDFESQRAMAAEAAYGLINHRNAESIVAFLNEYDDAMKNHSDIDEETKNHFVFRTLRKIAPTLLDIIDEEKMLPQYQHQVKMAKEWGKVTGDINAIISNADRDETWKANLRKNMDIVVEAANNKEGILSNLEQVVDDTDGSEASKDFDYVLKELEKIGYQRDATVLENRKDRREREEAARKKREEIKEKLDKEVEAAAKKKAEERKKETKHTLNKKAVLSLSPQKIGALLGISDTETIKKDMAKYQAEVQRQAEIIARYLDGEIGVKDALMELGYDEGYVTNSSEEDLKISFDEDVDKFKELLDKPVENISSEDVMGSMPFSTMRMDAEVSEDTIKILAASTGKTVEEVKRAIAELRTAHNKTKYEAWGIPSSAMGNTADIITRDFFAGKLKDHYPNITDEVLQAFIDQLEAFKKDLEAKEIHIVSEGVMAHGIITTTDEKGNIHKLPVAGTLDLFGYDDKGNYYIFDMKTTRNHSESKLMNEQFKWSRQISMYADLLKQTYGISVNRDNLRIIPINVYYPGPKGTEKGMSPTGPVYSVDKKTGQLKMQDTDGKTTDFIQGNKENFQLRSTKVDEQFQPGYFKLNIGWDNLTSVDQDTALTLDKSEVSKKVETPANVEDAVKAILEDSKNFVLSEDENYYYIKDKKTGKIHKFARVTSVISADKSVPQWKPTNQAVYDHLEGLTPAHEIAPDGSNLLPADIETGDITGMEFKESPGVWKVDILLEDESGDMEVSSGEMWYGTTENPKKGTFTAEKTGSTITFGISEGDSGMKSEILTVTPEEYESSNSTKRRTIQESFKEIGLVPGEFAGNVRSNDPKGNSTDLTHLQAEVIRKQVKNVLKDPNATIQRLHAAIVSTERKTSANANFLHYMYKALDAIKEGRMSIDEVMGLLEYHLDVDDAAHKEFMHKRLYKPAETTTSNTEVSQLKEDKLEINKNAPKGDYANRIGVGVEFGYGASHVKGINIRSVDHRSYSAKGSKDSEGNIRNEQLEGVDIYDYDPETVQYKALHKTEHLPESSLIVYSSKNLSSARGQGGITIGTWRKLTAIEKRQVRDYFESDYFNNLMNTDSNWVLTAAKDIDSIMMEGELPYKEDNNFSKGSKDSSESQASKDVKRIVDDSYFRNPNNFESAQDKKIANNFDALRPLYDKYKEGSISEEEFKRRAGGVKNHVIPFFEHFYDKQKQLLEEINREEENTPKEKKDFEEKRDFEATSMEKKDGEWYFNGNFAGSEETTQVKMKDNFSIDEAIERQQKAREAEFVAEGVDTGNPNIIVDGDDVYVVSKSIEEQAAEAGKKDTGISTIEGNQDIDTVNEKGENEINTNETTLSGNAMGPYKSDPLVRSGILERKVGNNPNDNMNQFFAWMKAEGVNVQNIIDHELSQILAVTPNAKVKFMAVNPKNNATNDRAMQTFLMLVLDYDDNINKYITSIHNDDNGGVIESNGKKYLIIGTVGYGSKNKNTEKLALYDTLWSNNPNTGNGYGLMKLARAKFFESHPNERFYVNETLSTEIVPSYPTPGWVVRQSEVDDVPGIFRSISELLYKNGKINEDRNPYHYDLENVAWGIQEYSKFLTINIAGKSVMSPKEPVANAGRVFILMPASNGKLFPSPVKALMHTEMRDGALKNRVDALLQEVTALDYETRMKAILKLAEIFYFNPDGDFIITRKTRNEISLIHNGKILKSFILDSNFDRMQFLEAFQKMNPRVNVTAKVLSNISLLKEYDEAGALMTDAAIFGTAGSSYSIYGLNSRGEILKPSDPVTIIPDSNGTSDFKNGDRSQVVFNHEYYVLENDKFYLNGKEITDSKTIKQLQYNKRIIDGQLVPIVDKGVWDYYVLSTGENPEVIKVDRNTKKVKELTKEESREIIEEVAKKKEAEMREEEAKKKNEALIKESKGKEEDVDLGVDDITFKIDPETGEMIQEEPSSSDTTPSVPGEESLSSISPSTDSIKEEPEEKHKAEKEEKKKIRDSAKHESFESISENTHTGATQKFTDLIRNKAYTRRIVNLVKNKWKNAPTKPSEISAFLKSKNVEVDNIGTTKEDIEAWIKTIEDCR